MTRSSSIVFTGVAEEVVGIHGRHRDVERLCDHDHHRRLESVPGRWHEQFRSQVRIASLSAQRTPPKVGLLWCSARDSNPEPAD